MLNNRKMLVILGLILAILVITGITFASPGRIHVRKGAKAQADGNYPLAVQEYRLALESDPDNWDAQVKLGEVLLEQKDYASALEALKSFINQDEEKAKKIYPLLARSYQGLAKLARDKEEEIFPASSSLLYIEQVPIKQSKALDYLEWAVKYDPENAELKKLLAEELFRDAHRATQQFTLDETKLIRIIALDPRPLYRLELAKLYVEQKRTAEFDQIIKSFTPEELADETVAFRLTQVLLDPMSLLFKDHLHEVISAEQKLEAYSRGLEVMPNNLTFLLGKMQVLFEKGRKDQAKQVIDTPNLSPEDRELLDNYWLGLTGNSFVRDSLSFKGVPRNSTPQIFNTVKGPFAVWMEDHGIGRVAPSGAFLRETKIVGLELNTGKQVTLAEERNLIISSLKGIAKDGSLVFKTLETGPSRGIGIYLKTGNNTKKVTEIPDDRSLWTLDLLSPDGRFLAINNDSGVTILELETGSKKDIAAKGFLTAWSPDSTQIMVSGKIYNINGEEVEKTPLASGYMGWTNQGQVIIYRGWGGSTPTRNWSLQVDVVDQGKEKSLVKGSLLPALSGGKVSWSPDDSYVLFEGTASSTYWLLPKGKAVPFPVMVKGDFLGWAGPNKPVFSSWNGPSRVQVLTVGEK
jgi:tetratricopeptide (TPR) repeat protein